MKRREFITLLGGAAAAWPLAARAQQSERVRRIGVLMNVAADDPLSSSASRRFCRQCGIGLEVGRNLRIDYRWGQADPDRLRRHAAELVALAPDVIVVARQPVRAPLQQATRNVPIVFAIVRSGRCRLCREPGAAGRQYHGVHELRVRAERKMAGAAQRDRA